MTTTYMAESFAVVAPFLADYGYPPVPIKPGFKAPMIDDWQAGHPPDHYLPHVDPQTGKRTDCRSWGTGYPHPQLPRRRFGHPRPRARPRPARARR